MGTRSLTVFQDGENEICVMYRQYDGYPSGIGSELKEAFGEHTVVNGISNRDAKIANGMGCLAAQVVAKFKEGVGNIYLHKAGTRDCGEEFIYTLYCAGPTGPLRLKIQSGMVTFFGLPGTKQAQMPTIFDGLLSELDVEKLEAVEP